MTEQETRKKIAEIMERVWYAPVPCTIERKHEAIADALIAAGIGDVGEYKKEKFVYRCEIAFLDKKINELEHSAEVAERALKNLMLENVKSEANENDDELMIEINSNMLCNLYLKRAEEELAEERKNVD